MQTIDYMDNLRGVFLIKGFRKEQYRFKKIILEKIM